MIVGTDRVGDEVENDRIEPVGEAGEDVKIGVTRLGGVFRQTDREGDGGGTVAVAVARTFFFAAAAIDAMFWPMARMSRPRIGGIETGRVLLLARRPEVRSRKKGAKRDSFSEVVGEGGVGGSDRSPSTIRGREGGNSSVGVCKSSTESSEPVR